MPIFSGKCKSKARLDGKNAVITGCNTGIGKVTAKDFVKRGCRVIMACRDVSKAEVAAQEIRKETEGVQGVGEIVVVRLDLASFASVRQCAQQLLRTETQINLLINNAGIAAVPKGKTEDGFEKMFGVNHLGPFLFTLLLLPLILKSAPARIVNVSSMGHIVADINFDDINSDKSFNHTKAYVQSKLANILFAKELAKRLQGTGVSTYSLHPGIVDTDISRQADDTFFKGSQWLIKNVLSHAIKSPEQGAQTTIHCAVDEKAANETGLYYSDCKKTKPSSKARDPALALRLWEESIKMTGLQDYDPFTAEVTPALVAQVQKDIPEDKDAKEVTEAPRSDLEIMGIGSSSQNDKGHVVEYKKEDHIDISSDSKSQDKLLLVAQESVEVKEDAFDSEDMPVVMRLKKQLLENDFDFEEVAEEYAIIPTTSL